MTGDPLPYLWGALGGAGILLMVFGLGRVVDRGRPAAERRAGLWMINGGLVCLAGSAALLMWAG